MFSKNKKQPTASEKAHIARIATLPCSVCDTPGPSEVHEMRQGCWWTAMSLCTDCHRGEELGWHGRRRMWNLRKMTEIDGLAVTVQRLMEMDQ